MNVLVARLLEQACFETEFDDNQNLNEMSERFAELIVEECLFILEHDMTEQLECSYDEGYIAAKTEARILIRDRFDMVDPCSGVENESS